MGATVLSATAKVENAIVAHLLTRLAKTKALDTPFPHFYVEGVFPDDIYAQMVEEIPPIEAFWTMGPRHVLPDGTQTRFELPLSDANLTKLDPVQHELWSGVRAALSSIELKRAIFKKLSAGLSYRFDVPAAQVSSIEAHPRVALMRETKGYYIAPHPDTRKKIVTMQIALPRDRSQLGLGTALYRRSLAPRDCVSVPRGFRKVKQFPFAPNTGYAFSVLNQVGVKSWHGCELLGENAGIRHSLLNSYYANYEHTGAY